MGLWSTKSLAALQDDPTLPGGASVFKRVLGSWDLTSLGVGAIIGAGIFVLTGTVAAQYAGPAVALSFVVAGLGCLFVGLCYAEFASMIPVAGSAYSYAYASLGELAAWIVGWHLIAEYLFGAASVAVSWSDYFTALLQRWGHGLPASLTHGPFVAEYGWQVHRAAGGMVNLPAVILILAATALLAIGIRASARANNVLVIVKLAIVLLIIVFGFMYVSPTNWHPFLPPSGGSLGRYGWPGVFRGATLVFFAFIGFDVIASVTQEARSPQRDMPNAILASLGMCAVLYVLMALIMTGLTHYSELNAPHPLAVAMSAAGPALRWLIPLIDVAIVAGLASVTLVLLLGLPRLLFAMARDGLLPASLGAMRSRREALMVPTLVVGSIAALVAGFFPLGILLELVSVSTLVSFIFVCAGVLLLRYRQPNLRRPFRAPLVPAVPILGILFSVATMLNVPSETWLRLAVWNVAGLAIYFLYGARKSLLSRPAFTAVK